MGFLEEFGEQVWQALLASGATDVCLRAFHKATGGKYRESNRPLPGIMLKYLESELRVTYQSAPKYWRRKMLVLRDLNHKFPQLKLEDHDYNARTVSLTKLKSLKTIEATKTYLAEHTL